MHTHSLFELNEHIRRIMALNFQQPLWIVAELAQIGESRGHRYLDLVQKDPATDDIIAQAQAAIWASEFRQINARMPQGLPPLLQEGLELRMFVRPEFHERYGFKLHITDIDPAHTFGQLDIRRRQTIQTLRELGLLDLNRSLTLPPVLQRIAVISSETAAGLQDFREHLEGNNFGYTFDCQYFTASVQGKNAETELLAALREVVVNSARFDAVVIVRGGGAKLDLMVFDALELCQTAARLPLPLLTGIGHDVDESVLDMVAHTALKTPTAVADFLVQHNLIFEGEVLEAAQTLEQIALNTLKYAQLELDRVETTLQFSAREHTRRRAYELDSVQQTIPLLTRNLIQRQQQTLDQYLALCQSMHPNQVLQRGYSITRKNGRALQSPLDANTGDLLDIQLSEGHLKATVQ
ncbi:MAG: exodeoxyribonuclease VII large subunit [Chitinophagales bacterium]|nr:exodeoxyribonuclease VII large subunit [Chitinophagales bacterium]